MRPPEPTPPIERVAAVTERLAVLLAAGVSPPAAWGYLAAAMPARALARRPDPARVALVLAAAAAAAREGDDIAAAIASTAQPAQRLRTARASPATDAWLTVAAAWSVAIDTGAPLAGCLRQLARSQLALGQVQRDIAAALAGPRSTSRLVTGLPAVGLLFGLLLGFDTVGALLGTVPGVLCLVSAVVLTLIAWRWSAAMVGRATPTSSVPGLAIDLTAIAMSSGASVPRALTVVQAALAAYRPVAGDPPADTAGAIQAVLELSQAAGIPAAELLRGEAARVRRDARSSAQQAAASLATRLMLPLGVCILPAFLLVGVVPLLMSVLSSTVRGIG